MKIVRFITKNAVLILTIICFIEAIFIHHLITDNEIVPIDLEYEKSKWINEQLREQKLHNDSIINSMDVAIDSLKLRIEQNELNFNKKNKKHEAKKNIIISNTFDSDVKLFTDRIQTISLQ